MILMRNAIALVLFFCITPQVLMSQSDSDSLLNVFLEEISVEAIREMGNVKPVAEYSNLMVLGGRKLEEIPLRNTTANIAEKVGRQVFSKIPGAFVYDMDGAGNQVNLSLRGLDAHRSWEFSVRQNNIITNTDIYGYPASHYSAPMEAIDRVEIIRGTGALQYGQQFGGMVNYITKSPDPSKPISFESITTAGSNGLLSSYNAIGGKLGYITYYAYYQRRVSDGYRDNSSSDSEAQLISVKYDFPDIDLSVKAELSRSTYLYQIPGPLNDEMFEDNPRQSTRFRDFYSPDIVIPSLSIEWNPGENTRLNLVASGVFGDRSSVRRGGNSLTLDAIDPETNDFRPRDVAIHDYYSRTAELRLLHHYKLGEFKNDLSISLRYFNNKNIRRQRGVSTTGVDFDLSVPGEFGRDLKLLSESAAVTVENQFWLSEKMSISPGLRFEYGASDLTGRIDYIEEGEVPLEIPYEFLTLGIHGQYFLSNGGRVFAGVSQANRPVLFQDLIPGDPFSRIARDLEHSLGYNAELGFENHSNHQIQYSLTFFRTYIGDRIGTLVETIGDDTYLTNSNIGNSMTDGVELFVNYVISDSDKLKWSVYNASSWMNGRYTSGEISKDEENISIKDNKIESVPEWIVRSGTSLELMNFSVLLQHQYVGSTYADPLNTAQPTPSGSVGLVPSYQVWDLSASYRLTRQFEARVSVNNVLDEQYFTKRPTMYPGPGVWPSDGRSFSFTGILRL
ncbi:MAG: TonB-dependent receptor [Saprospirales bacterium]|nr:MAG: TonB-dependent receptor [Saprospirales bacterium]